MGHCRSPGMEDGGDADPCAQMFGIGGNGQHGLRARLEQQVIDDLLVLIGDGGDLSRQGEDDMKIPDRKQFGLAVGQPVARRRALAFGAVAVAAGVVGDRCMVAVLAARSVAAERHRAASLDGVHDFHLIQADMTTIGRPPCSAMVAEDIRDLEMVGGMAAARYGAVFSLRFCLCFRALPDASDRRVPDSRSMGLSTAEIIPVATRV